MGLFFEIQTTLDPTDIHTVHVDQNQLQHYTLLKLSDTEPFAIRATGAYEPCLILCAAYQDRTHPKLNP